jgi:probable F420-dependent oxidoreductase
MQVGVTVPNVHETLATPEAIEAVGRRAEELGFDSVWANDHVVIPSAPDGAAREPGYAAAYGQQRGQAVFDPLVTLAFLAGATSRVLLGTSVYLLPLRHPLVTAKQVATLDSLSGGRVVFGVGVGWLEGEFAVLGVSFRERGARSDEAISILKQACGEERGDMLPKPAQRPHPPLWIGGRSDAALRRAARSGDAWHPSHLTLDELRSRGDALRRECERHGRAPDEVALTTRRKLVLAAGGDDPERVLAGSPEQIGETFDALAGVGVSHLIVEIPGSTAAELDENLDWFGREVLPAARHARA